MCLHTAGHWSLRATFLYGFLAAHSLLTAAEPARPFEFTRMIAHWAQYGNEDYLAFVKAAQPEVAQLGFYGAHFWSLSHTPQFGGYPAHFPVRGLDACGDWFSRRNAALHQSHVKVIGHFNVEFLVGDPEGPHGPRGFFAFYDRLWDERILGPKPVASALEMLERGADGQPLVQQTYRIGGMREYWACLRNPHWQQVLKAWTKQAIRRGVDGLIINYFYRHNCLCKHCVSGFRGHLSQEFSAAELRTRFGISDLQRQKFDELVCWHDPLQSTPLKMEMLRWSQISNKRVYDDVFVRYGRSLKPDLILAQWNHLGDFTQIAGDERCALPARLWGRDEDYLWYSAGGSANTTDLKRNRLGDVTLQARYIRGAFADKPFTIGKYENTRIRSAIAELAANGGAPMGFYTRFQVPEARQEIIRYYQFLKRHEGIFRGNRSHAEAVLLFPRTRVHTGDITAVQTFREHGQQLLDQHVLFDVVPDDLWTARPTPGPALVLTTKTPLNLEPARSQTLSRFDAPATVRISATRPQHGQALDVHFVNYNRTEPKPGADGRPSPGGGIQDERPLAVDGIQVDIVMPRGFQAGRVEMLTPESPAPRVLAWHDTTEHRIRFRIPEFLVYAVARIHLQPLD
ncbi:MAG: hypothetical protein ABGZ17_17660 [Planctomycetaceae bacterium]